jgi:putative membrane protein
MIIKKSVAIVAIILMVTACTRHGVDSQNDDNSETESVNSANASEKNDTVSSPDNQSNNQQGKSDADFVLAAADGGMLEVRLGELAMKQASSPNVQAFAKTMTIDHGKANEELKTIATKLNISVASGLSAKSQQKYDDLAQKKGGEFDKAYAGLMVSDHQETIEKFRTEANNGQQTEIRNWAEAKIPTLEHHLKMAERINAGKSPVDEDQ